MSQKIRKERITKVEFYERGGFANSARTLNDAIAYLRGAPRDEGESFLVVVHCLRETRKWRYRLTYGGSQYNIIAEWIEP